MANTDTRDRAKDEVEKSGKNGSGSTERVVSDRRARSKAKRGESFVKVEEASVAAETQKKDRPTPSRRNAPKAGTEKRNIFQRIPVVRPIYNYLNASAAEMRKVTWPTRDETVRLTRMVLAVMIVSSIVLGTIDLFYGWWFRQALDNETLFLMLGVVVSLVGGAFAYVVFAKRDEFSAY